MASLRSPKPINEFQNEINKENLSNHFIWKRLRVFYHDNFIVDDGSLGTTNAKSIMSIQLSITPTFKKNNEIFENIEKSIKLKWSYALKMKSEIPTVRDSTQIFEMLYSETVGFDKLEKKFAENA